MINDNDWRIRKQIDYLYEKVLLISVYSKKSEEWDHDYCEFCWKKFGDGNVGYCTLDYKFWICEECYTDFKESFKWKIQNTINNKMATK